MGRTLVFIGECNCEVLEGNPVFPSVAVKSWSIPRWNLAVRWTGTAGGDRKVQLSPFGRQVEDGRAFVCLGLYCEEKPGVVTRWTLGATSRLQAAERRYDAARKAVAACI
jgi:hypothetical protein